MSKQKMNQIGEELDSLFEGLGGEGTTSGAKASKPAAKPGSTATAAALDDPLAGLASLVEAKPVSRPQTPRQAGGLTASNARPRQGTAEAATPSSTGSARTSEDRNAATRKSGESSRSYHQAFTPASTNDGSPSEELDRQTQDTPRQHSSSGGGWLGGLWSTATAVRKQAEAAVQEIRNNEEAQKWAQGVMKGKIDVGALRDLGVDLRSRALPTFTNLLHTLAPPISQHERLLIHATHDLLNYPSLDPTIYSAFSRVMAQVEGGDLLVIQRGSESGPRSSSEGYRGPGLSIAGTNIGWTDGPWWRQGEVKRDMGIVKGVVEGRKLAKVGAETFANEFFASKGGIEAVQKQATESMTEDNPVRSSDIFLSIQAVSFQNPAAVASSKLPVEGGDEKAGAGDEEDDDDEEELCCFALYLHDPVHKLSFPALSQAFPLRWAGWLDEPALQHPDGRPGEYYPPEEIAQVVLEGGVDPREWVSEWVEEALGLAVGVLAQRYVARRMGVGEGAIAAGKRRETTGDGAGEAARAIGGL